MALLSLFPKHTLSSEHPRFASSGPIELHTDLQSVNSIASLEIINCDNCCCLSWPIPLKPLWLASTFDKSQVCYLRQGWGTAWRSHKMHEYGSLFSVIYNRTCKITTRIAHTNWLANRINWVQSTPLSTVNIHKVREKIRVLMCKKNEKWSLMCDVEWDSWCEHVVWCWMVL